MISLDVNLLSFVFSVVVGLISMVWSVSNARHDQQKELTASRHSQQQDLAALRSEIYLEIQEIKHKLQLLECDNRHDHETFEYIDHDLRKTIAHKVERMMNMIKDINQYLSKKGDFRARNGFNSSSEERE